MGNSLIDQLKKTGLVDKKKAQQVKHGQYKNQKKKNRKGAADHVDEAKLLSQKAQAEKVERDRQMNLQKKKEAEHKAVAAQIIQLIETNRVEDGDGDIAHNFTDANVVKRIFVSEQAHKYLMSGRLAIAKLGEAYALVPAPVAEKIRQRDAECIINVDGGVEVNLDEDDPYADYVIPDDLIW